MSMHAEPRRILVIADEVVGSRALRDVIVAQRDTEVLVVAPAPDGDADARLAASLASLDRAGVHVQGWIGDADPIRAIADALATFSADELLIATPTEHGCGRPADDDLVAEACARFLLPVAHLVVEHADTPAALVAA